MNNMDFDKLYKEWSGEESYINSNRQVHDSAEMMDFAKYCNSDIIDFAVYLTGHNKETINQMYKDWKK